MSTVVLFMARSQLLWVLWMLVGTPLVMLGLLLDIAFAGPRQFRPQWRFEWRYEVRDWFARFTPRYRASLRSLAARPAACGSHWRKE